MKDLNREARNEGVLLSDSDDEVDSDDVVAYSAETRLRVGQVFFEYKGITTTGMIPSAGVEEMFVYLGFAEEYDLQKPTLPDNNGHVRAGALLGYRFKRSKLDGKWQLVWRQGGEGARAIEKDPSVMTLSALKVTHSSKIYVVEGDVSTIFGGELLTMFNEVLSSSPLFEAHREHQLLVGTDPLSILRRMSRGTLASKPVEELEKLLTGVYATALYGIAGTFSKNFEALAKASKSQQSETAKELVVAMTDCKLFLRKHLLWMLRDVTAQKLKVLMATVWDKLGELEAAARAKLPWPEAATVLMQDEIRGGRDLSGAGGAGKGGGATRKNPKGGEKTYSPSKGADDDGYNKGGRGKKLRGSSLDELLKASQTPSALYTPGTSDLAAQLSASLAKMPSLDEVDGLKKQVSSLQGQVTKLDGEKVKLASTLGTETLRANSERTRADQEKQRADGLHEELTALRKGMDGRSVEFFHATSSATSNDTPEVSALKEEITWLRNQMQILTLLVGGNQAGAADLARKGQKK